MSHRFTIIFLSLIFLHSVDEMHAQSRSKEVNTQFQSWFSINSNIRIADRWTVLIDLHEKRQHFTADVGFHFARIGVGYRLNEHSTVAAGVAELWLAPARAGWQQFAVEKRIYQQIQWLGKFKRWSWIERIRNEQRWQPQLVNDGIDHIKFTNRIRLLAGGSYALHCKYLPSHLTLSNEICFQFGDEVTYNTFDQNRLFVGVRQIFNATWSMDLGYMQIFQQKANGYQYDLNHTFRCFVYFNPDMGKQKKIKSRV